MSLLHFFVVAGYFYGILHCVENKLLDYWLFLLFYVITLMVHVITTGYFYGYSNGLLLVVTLYKWASVSYLYGIL